jgi:hypothetical protein
MKKLLIPLILTGINFTLFGQSSWLEIDRKHHDINKKGMTVLGSWAVGNIVLNSSLLIAGTNDKRTEAFYQMNIGWNAVNLALAIPGFINARKKLQDSNKPDNAADIMEEAHNIEKILLLNTGLDVAYMAAGGCLMNIQTSDIDRKMQFEGFGAGLILQGGFLFAFDIIMYVMHRKNGRKINELMRNITVSTGRNGFTVSWNTRGKTAPTNNG